MRTSINGPLHQFHQCIKFVSFYHIISHPWAASKQHGHARSNLPPYICIYIDAIMHRGGWVGHFAPRFPLILLQCADCVHTKVNHKRNFFLFLSIFSYLFVISIDAKNYFTPLSGVKTLLAWMSICPKLFHLPLLLRQWFTVFWWK